MNTIYAFCDASVIQHFIKDTSKNKSKGNRVEAFCLGMVAFQFNIPGNPGKIIKKSKPVKAKTSSIAEILAIIEAINSIDNHYRNQPVKVQIYTDQLHLIDFIEDGVTPKRKKIIEYINRLKRCIKNSPHNISLNWVKSHVRETERNVLHVLHHEIDRLAYRQNRARAKQLRKELGIK